MAEDRTPRYDALTDPAIRLEDAALHPHRNHDARPTTPSDHDVVTERAEELKRRTAHDAVDNVVDHEEVANRGIGPRNRVS